MLLTRYPVTIRQKRHQQNDRHRRRRHHHPARNKKSYRYPVLTKNLRKTTILIMNRISLNVTDQIQNLDLKQDMSQLETKDFLPRLVIPMRQRHFFAIHKLVKYKTFALVLILFQINQKNQNFWNMHVPNGEAVFITELSNTASKQENKAGLVVIQVQSTGYYLSVRSTKSITAGAQYP